MKKIVSAVSAAAITGVLALGAVTPASAQASFGFSFGVDSERDRADRAFRRYCRDFPRDRDCRRFLRGDFRDRDYYDFYRTRRTQIDPIAGFFGFTLGTIFGAAAARARDSREEVVVLYDDDHVARCEARYRSYNRNTDQFLGFDGKYHYCTL